MARSATRSFLHECPLVFGETVQVINQSIKLRVDNGNVRICFARFRVEDTVDQLLDLTLLLRRGVCDRQLAGRLQRDFGEVVPMRDIRTLQKQPREKPAVKTAKYVLQTYTVARGQDALDRFVGYKRLARVYSL